MDYVITTDPERSIIFVRVLRTINDEVALAFMTDAIRRSHQEECKLHIVDVRGVTNSMSTTTQYDLAYNDAHRLDLPLGSRIGLVTDSDDNSHDFIETLFRNAGYRCQVFHSDQEAIQWLMSE